MVGLSCPRCDTRLDKKANGSFACKACRIDFPSLPVGSDSGQGNLPFIWPEPGAALLDWRNRYNLALADLEQQIDACGRPATPAATPASTQRIKHLQQALTKHQTQLSELLQPLNTGEALAREVHLALRTRLPSHHGVLSYAQNILRDWSWGEAENRQVLEHLTDALQQSATDAPESILVLGCGAGRLAYDLHRQFTPQRTWALDSNPLLCLIGQRMANGEQLEFNEFPLAPVSVEDVAICRTLQAPQAVEGLHFVCADALRLPFGQRQFDLIVTPWLLDVIDASVTELLAVIARTLKDGGTWLTHGSVAFTGAVPWNRLTATELAELTAASGFDVQYTQNVTLPYLQSPASRAQRSEVAYTQVATLNAVRAAELATGDAPARHQHLPDWIVTGKTPVPLTPGFQTQITTTRIHAFIMSLIDGKRSVRDMAQILEQQRLMPAAQAAEAIRQFLTTMQEEDLRSQGRAGGHAD